MVAAEIQQPGFHSFATRNLFWN